MLRGGSGANGLIILLVMSVILFKSYLFVIISQGETCSLEKVLALVGIIILVPHI